ncbi:MAG: hypothetical protein UT05_C0002G0066 [Parcubacteria group bacterium GW2011_GWF2_38_76]|nr:MAG: hypothetical protein UT05_C0002G0066 [Parcubacteria group bacterium GW2011_GWF2_38_76]HBM45776.1 hypothetical protein [Patescibacteria group bacterium]
MSFLCKKKIVLSASYGLGNLGDEAICKTLIEDLFSTGLVKKITVLVFDKVVFINNHPELIEEKRVSIREFFVGPKVLLSITKIYDFLFSIYDLVYCDLFILGGGGLIRNRNDWFRFYIQPLKIVQFFHRKTAIFSIGVDAVEREDVILGVNKIKRVDFFSVRDNESKNNLLAINKNFSDEFIKVIPDPVFHMKSIYNHSPENKKIGFNLTSPDLLSLGGKAFDKGKFLNDLSGIFNELFTKEKFELVCLPTDTQKDSLFMSDFISSLNKEIHVTLIKLETPEQFLKEVSRCRCFIGMRMHSLIMSSIIEGLPILGIVYAKKVENMFGEIGFKNIVSADIISGRDSIIKFLSRPEDYVFDFKSTKDSSYDGTKKIQFLLR